MSFIPGTEHRLIPAIAPKASHGKNCKKLHRSRATTERDMKLLNQLQQDPHYVKNLHASIALKKKLFEAATKQQRDE